MSTANNHLPINEVRAVLDDGPFTPLQRTVFGICLFMNVLDGMDVTVISYAAPALADVWAITPGTLGTVFSAALLGMMLGALLLAPLADRFGRRRMIMACLVIMGAGTLLTAYAQSVGQLILLRAISGLGIGGMLATAATMTAEFTPSRHRNFAVSAVFAGYPIGAMLTGVMAAWLIPGHGWPALFQVAGAVTLLSLLPVWLWLPESIDFLLKTRPAGALDAVNRVLLRMGRGTLAELPPRESITVSRASVTELLSPARKESTLWLWTGYFASYATLYFLLSWIPKLANSSGLSLELAIHAGTLFNLGAVFGIVGQGWLSGKFGLRRMICTFLFAGALLMAAFGYFSTPWVVLLMFALVGFLMQGGFVGLYALAAWLYPTEIRNTGIGWGIGAGRIGAIVGPKFAGTLVGLGFSLAANFMVFAVPLLLAGVAALKVKIK